MRLSTARTGVVRRHAPIALATLAAAGLPVWAVAGAATAEGASAHAAHAISVRDEAKLHEVSRSGNSLSEEGPATGTLGGTATASISTSGTFVKVKAVLHVGGGTITVTGEGHLSTGGGTEVSFTAPGRVTGGTGKYRHASGSGTVYGAENRVTHAARIQVVGHLSY